MSSAAHLASVPECFLSAVTLAELNWIRNRLDPQHPQTARMLASTEAALASIDPARVLTPSADQWRTAGEHAGTAVRAVAGELRTFRVAADRHELSHDALISTIASAAGVTVVTEDRDFDRFLQLDPALDVLFYDRA